MQTVADLPASVDAPLPVTCWVWDAVGMYEMGTDEVWRELYNVKRSN